MRDSQKRETRNSFRPTRSYTHAKTFRFITTYEISMPARSIGQTHFPTYLNHSPELVTLHPKTPPRKAHHRPLQRGKASERPQPISSPPRALLQHIYRTLCGHLVLSRMRRGEITTGIHGYAYRPACRARQQNDRSGFARVPQDRMPMQQRRQRRPSVRSAPPLPPP